MTTISKNNISNGIYGAITFLREDRVPKLWKDKDYATIKEVIDQIQTLERIQSAVSKLPDGLGVDEVAYKAFISQSLKGSEPFFVYDADAGFSYFDTAEKAVENTENRMRTYENAWCDSGKDWGNVSTLCWGVVLGYTVEKTIDDGRGQDTQVYNLVTP